MRRNKVILNELKNREKINNEIYKRLEVIIYRITSGRGIHIAREDKEDLVQDCLNYIIENGNMLDKKGNPIIKDEYVSKHNKNRIFSKSYYYAMRNVENYRRRYSEYIENVKYNNEEYMF